MPKKHQQLFDIIVFSISVHFHTSIFVRFSLTLCVFVSDQEPVGNPGQRDLLLLHLLQRERQHWYNTNTHTHAHKLKEMYVLCALALKLRSEQYCYFVETRQTYHYISVPN